MWRRFIVSLLILVSCSAAHAAAEDGWRVEAEVGTDFPLQVGVSGTLVTPQRIRLRTSLGFLPESYLDSIHAICVEAGCYDDTTALLISAALQDALIWKVGVGWQPVSDLGFYIAGGYTLATLGGGLSGVELVTAVTGKNIQNSGNRQVAVNSTVHFLDVEIGWTWELVDRLTLRLALGGSFTVDSSTRIEPSWEPTKFGKPAVDDLTLAGENYLDDVMESYVHTAVLSLALGWRF